MNLPENLDGAPALAQSCIDDLVAIKQYTIWGHMTKVVNATL